MSNYFIGDIHGCYKELILLLNKINFSIKKDKLWITGDLVFKGPQSIKVLKYLFKIRKNVNLVLGNNDIKFLKFYINKKNKKYKILNWLRKQKLTIICTKKKIIMVHAGIPIEWGIKEIKKYSKKTEKIISNIYKYPLKFLLIYKNNKINKICSKMNNLQKISFTLNSLTRMRYYYNKSKILDFKQKKSIKNTSTKYIPWFSIKNNNISKKYIIIFGHWSSLEKKKLPDNLIGLDTGCYRGGYLTLINLEKKKIYKQKKITN